MSKSAAATFHRFCRKPAGWLCAVLSALTLLLPALAVAAVAEPSLRRSDELDLRRLGRVSETERAVLRVEWRAAVSGEEQAQAVQEMLDSVRRMEATVGEITRLMSSMPAQKPGAAVAAPESGVDEKSLALAAGAVAGLLALWWFSRRKSASHAAAGAAPGSRAEPGAPGAAATPATEPGPAADAAKADPPALPPAKPEDSSTASSEPAQPAPTDALLAAELAAIDFSLEDAEPEAVARANARVPVPRTTSRPMVPERRQPLNVEPTLQLAEIMLSMGLQQGAAQALVEYAEANPRNAVYHWLKLLGIYRDGGQRKDFEETAEKLRKHFNIQAEDPTTSGKKAAPTLEDFPRVAQQVQQLWPQPEECIAYLRHLLEDNRDGARAGFPQSVAEEFLLLIEILKANSGARQPAGA